MTGRPLCRIGDIPDGEARGFSLGEGRSRVDILAARRGGAVFLYRNACPHAGTPLDWVPDRFMSPDGIHLQCATHGALFRVEDGYCVAGPCAGRSLTPVPAEIGSDGTVRATLPG
jgi:nitrite reductase/ring-hydroxylating ferredoxin subunit